MLTKTRKNDMPTMPALPNPDQDATVLMLRAKIATGDAAAPPGCGRRA